MLTPYLLYSFYYLHKPTVLGRWYFLMGIMAGILDCVARSAGQLELFDRSQMTGANTLFHSFVPTLDYYISRILCMNNMVVLKNKLWFMNHESFRNPWLWMRSLKACIVLICVTRYICDTRSFWSNFQSKQCVIFSLTWIFLRIIKFIPINIHLSTFHKPTLSIHTSVQERGRIRREQTIFLSGHRVHNTWYNFF